MSTGSTWIAQEGGGYSIEMPSLYPAQVMAHVDSVVIGGMRFERYYGRECEMSLTFKGSPCNDYVCSACGKMHNAPRVSTYCPRCGARIVAVVDATGR